MRIGIDMQSSVGRKTGIGQYAERLLAALRRLAPEHEYLRLTWGQDVAMRTDRRLRWQQWLMPRLARMACADLLHVPGFDAPLWKPCPVVLTVHDLIGMLFPRNLPPVSRLYWANWLPFTIRFADVVLADSECTRRDIARLLRLPPERIEVIPLGVDERFAPQSRGDIEGCRAQYALPEHFVLYVGTIEPRKGVDILIDAFAKVARRLPHHLVITGKRGWYWEPVSRRAAASAVGDRIHFLDYLADEDLPALYAAASVFVFPSRYEGFGLPVLEAMACGAPVVCSSASSLPEVAGQAALLVSPGQPEALAEAIEAVLDDSALREGLREKGLRRARNFTWEKTARATLRVYERVAEGASQAVQEK